MQRTVDDVMREDAAEDYVSYSRRDGKLLIAEIIRLRAEVAAKEAALREIAQHDDEPYSVRVAKRALLGAGDGGAR